MGKRRPDLTTLPTVFVDSSAFFTAVNSPSGGSAKIFSLSRREYKLVASKVILAETERNVSRKLLPLHLDRFFRLIELVEVLDQLPDDRLIQQAKQVIVAKDAVILAEASQARTGFLLTLEKKHFQTDPVKNFLVPTRIVTPKDLLS